MPESKDLPLMPSVARGIIEELFSSRGQWKRADLAVEVEKTHLQRGGLKGSQDPQRIVKKALSVLEEEGKVESPAYGQWRWIQGGAAAPVRESITIAPSRPDASAGDAVEERPSAPTIVRSPDPTIRIGRLPSATGGLKSVNPSSPIATAVTQMILYDYSQMPVVHNGRTVRGAVTWKSIGAAFALGRPCAAVEDCLERAHILELDVSLFDALPTIVEKGFVLVRDGTGLISGIVTPADVSLQFRQLAEPFLLLGEIERRLRRLSAGKFTAQEIAAARDPADTGRQVRDETDLTLGEYLRLLQNPSRWNALGLTIDRSTFMKRMDDVREIRNDVMHFDADGTLPAELETLRQVVRLLNTLGA
jgi:CBS domain-containing protein